MNKITIGNDIFEVFLSEKEILEKVKELGTQLTLDYKDKIPVFIGILNGSFMFFSDLLKEFEGDCEVDFLKLSSYHEAKVSSGKVDLLKDINATLTGREVIIVEDIVDSGLSVEFILKHLKRHEPKSVKIVSLLVKPRSIKYNISIDYSGFNIPNNFVIGYGLDLAQKFRNLKSVYKHIGTVEEDK